MNPTDLRETIPALETTTYFNWGAGGPSPRAVVDAVESTLESHEYVDPAGPGMYGGMGDRLEATREDVARLLGASPDEVALTHSTTDGINRVAAALDWTAGDVVVRTDLEHSSGILPWRRLERDHGVEVRVLETDRGRLDLTDVRAAAEDATLFCVSSLTWTHGTHLPVTDIVDVAHDAGASVLVDAVQQPGQTAIDVGEWGADFVVGAGHKWLLGPFGAGFLHVRNGVETDVVPGAIGYRGVEDPNARDYVYEPGARRFEVGTVSPAPFAGLAKAIEVHESMGVETVEARIQRLAERLVAGIPGDRLLSPREPTSGFVTITDDDPEATVERLAEKGIVVRSLPNPTAVRASVHAVNTEEDVDNLLAALPYGTTE